MVNWKGLGRKWSWSISKYYSCIHLVLLARHCFGELFVGTEMFRGFTERNKYWQNFCVPILFYGGEWSTSCCSDKYSRVFGSDPATDVECNRTRLDFLEECNCLGVCQIMAHLTVHSQQLVSCTVSCSINHLAPWSVLDIPCFYRIWRLMTRASPVQSPQSTSVSILPSTPIKNLPALRRPSSAACPPGRMLFTKMLRAPRGESRPPTIVKPSPFFPLPFSNMTVWNEQTDDRGRRGNVQKLVVDVRLLSSLLPISVTEEQHFDGFQHVKLRGQLMNKQQWFRVSLLGVSKIYK
jgi:hypothetical protein